MEPHVSMVVCRKIFCYVSERVSAYTANSVKVDINNSQMANVQYA